MRFMKWHNAVNDGTPDHCNEVLVSYRGVNFIAFYDKEAKGFRTKREKEFFPLSSDKDVIYWSEIEPPGQRESEA